MPEPMPEPGGSEGGTPVRARAPRLRAALRLVGFRGVTSLAVIVLALANVKVSSILLASALTFVVGVQLGYDVGARRRAAEAAHVISLLDKLGETLHELPTFAQRYAFKVEELACEDGLRTLGVTKEDGSHSVVQVPEDYDPNQDGGRLIVSLLLSEPETKEENGDIG